MKNIISFFKKPAIIKSFILTSVVIVVLGIYYFVVVSQNRIHLDNSLVVAPVTPLSPTMPGKLLRIMVNEGQTVKKGDPIAVTSTETINAYDDGLVVATNKEIGSVVGPQTPIAQLVNIDTIRIDGTIDENKGLNTVHVGQTVSFTIDAIPGKTFWGYVDEVGQTARQTQLPFSISSERPTQQFDVYVKFDAMSHPEIKNGMSAKMIVFTSTP